MEHLQEFLNRKNFAAVVSTTRAMALTPEYATPGTSRAQSLETALEVAGLVLRNTIGPGPRKRKGGRIPEHAMNLFRAVRIVGGERVYNLLRANLNLPHERTVHKQVCASKVPFREGPCESNFEILAEIYARAMDRHGIPRGSVPVLLAEDETAVVPEFAWDCVTDELVGGCGALCAMRCTHIKPCRQRRCLDPHACVPIKRCTLLVGDDDTSYDRMFTHAEASRCSTYLRALIINPLHQALPQLPCLLAGTCLTFTADDYVIPQWEQKYAWHRKHLGTDLGATGG